MSAKLLSSLVQTKSIELVMAPIAAQVSQLIILNEAGEREGVPMPMLVSHARQICTSIQSLVLAGQNLVADSSDEVFKKEMPEACLSVTAAGNNLLEASRKLIKQPFSREVRYALVDSARNILETTMQVLLVYDKAEVHKIVCAACWVVDRLGLTEAVTSMDSFLVSFRGFSESLMLLVSLCDKRQRELSNPKQRTRLLSAMAILKKAAGLLSSTMQIYFKNPTIPSSKVNRDYVVGQIKFACTEIIKIVENRDEETSSTDIPSMYSTMEKAKNQLHPSVAMDTSNQMDCYLDAIVRSSMAVANTCQDISRDRIVEACQNVLETRSDLTALQSMMASAPDSMMSRRKFDETTQTLSLGLKDLDSQVTLAIVEQIDDIFCNAEQPIKQLLDASTTPYTSENQEQANLLMTQKADKFQKHASKLVQISKHAASLSSDTQKIQLIKGLSNELEKLVPLVVTTAFTVKQNPFDQASIERLGLVSREWLNKLRVLTDALDDVTDMQDLLKVTGTCLYNDVAGLQEALIEQNSFKIAQTADSLLCRGQRYVQITKKAIARTDDPFNSEILASIDELETGLGSLSSTVDKIPLDISDRDKAHKYTTAIGDKVDVIQCKVTGTSPVNEKLQASAFLSQDSVQPLSMRDLDVPPQPMSATEKSTENKTDRYVSSKPPRWEREAKRQSQPTPYFTSSKPSSMDSSLSLSFESLVVESDEDGINWTDRTGRSLIGLSGSGQLFGEPIYLSCTSRAPVTRLIQAAKKGDRDNIEKFIKNIISQVTRLMGLAEKCVEKSNNVEQIRQIRVTSGEIEKLTPIITQAARDVATNSRDRTAVERLQLIGREWAAKAHVLGDAVDAIVVPWSAAASKLALAAATGDTGELKKQINNINDEAVRLRQLALSTIAAADAEDYAMDPGNENDDFERNPASFQRIKLLRATAEETDKVIPELILAAQSLVVNPADITRLEHLEFLRRVWACNVNNLITAVDDVIVGTSAPVEHLTNAAMMSDNQALQDRIRMVVSYTRTLKEMAAAATTGCTNPKKAVLVESTVASIERLTADLQDTACTVVNLSAVHKTSFEQELAFMSIEEKMKLLRREWATKVHLLTALVDDLTAHVSAPVDRLAGAALAVSRTEISKKPIMEREFEVQAQELCSRVARVRSQASKAVEQSSHASQVRAVRVTGDFIDRLTPQVIGSARALADNPDQPTVEHFQMLRRQWASKAQMLISTLRGLHDANPNAVESVIDDLLATRTLQTAMSFESLAEDDFSQLFSSPPDAKSSHTTSLPVSSPSPKPERKPAPPKTKPKGEKRKDFDKVERSLTDSEDNPKQRVPIGASSSETDLRTLLVRELHDRFSSNESLKRSKWDARYWAKFEVNRKKHQRAFSMADLSKNNSESLLSESTEDLRNRKSSKSIARAAQFLEDEADQWEEENNSIVKVAKKMAQQMMQMSQLARKRGKQQNKLEMSDTAKAIAANSRIIENFARTIADACADERSREDLRYYAECVPTMSTQLTIIASVKAAAPNDPSADAMLVRNADNLMQAVVKTLRAAEAASIKDFVKPSPITADEVEAANLAFQWKKKLQSQRKRELFTSSRDHLGLRKRQAKSTPSLVDIVHV